MFKLLVLPSLILSVQFASAVYAGGDREYGEYLASECKTCHQTKGTDSKIPVLDGYDEEKFVALMKAYRAGELENPSMINVAKRLTDEDIAALAEYFSWLHAAE